MNCDQAFDCLTDSTRRHSPQLEEHLAQCARCRQMHDTLEPALDMFDELIPEPDLSHGSIATQTLAPETVRVAEQAAARLQSAGAGKRRRGLSLRYAAAAMAGALLMGVMGSINRVDSSADHGVHLGTAEVMPPIPVLAAPTDIEREDPVQTPLECVFRSGDIDRDAYPTPVAVVQLCSNCHHEADDPLFPTNAQPISIEREVEDEETADLIVRVLSAQRQSLMLATVRLDLRSKSFRLA